jgi:hypothetical protein
MYIMAPEPIQMAYFIKPSHQSLCLYVNPPIVARQRLSKNVTTATNTDAIIEELLDASFSVRSVLYEGKWTFSSSQNFLLLIYVNHLIKLQTFGILFERLLLNTESGYTPIACISSSNSITAYFTN